MTDNTALNNDQVEDIVFTDSAVTKVKTLIEEEGNPNLKLRVFISGGGCSGFQYGLLLMKISMMAIRRLKKLV